MSRGRPRVLLYGPPAAGKTRIRDCIFDCLHTKGISAIRLGIEECHRALLPSGIKSADYTYDSHGALTLLKPEVQIPDALRLLIDQCVAAAAQTGFVAELAHLDPAAAFAEFGASGVLRGGVVVFIGAPLGLREKRNELRPSRRIPLRIVQSHPQNFDAAALGTIRDLGAHLLDVVNEGEEGTIRFHADRIIEAWFRLSGERE